MRRYVMVLLIVAALSLSILGSGSVQAQEEDLQTNLTVLINKLDTSITSLRAEDTDDASTLISDASTIYQSSFSSRIENIDNSLDSQIEQAFTSISQTRPRTGFSP